MEYNNDDYETWDYGDDDEYMQSIIPVRDQLARGDLRVLCLGWLHAVARGDFEDEQIEPPVPPGLADLSASLCSLAEFLNLDTDLIEAAAQASQPLTSDITTEAEYATSIAQLEEADKNALLLRVVNGDTRVGIELSRRVVHSDNPEADVQSRRSVADILKTAKARRSPA